MALGEAGKELRKEERDETVKAGNELRKEERNEQASEVRDSRD